MPDILVKGSVPKARGTEAATRLSILQSVDKLDEQFQLEQFLVRAPADLVFNSGLNRLEVSYGPGQVRWGTTFRAFAAGVATFPTPAAAASYNLVARSDGTVVLQAAATPLVNGQVLIGVVTTGNPLATGTLAWADRRGMLPDSDTTDLTGYVQTATLMTHQAANPIDHPNASVTAVKLAAASVLDSKVDASVKILGLGRAWAYKKMAAALPASSSAVLAYTAPAGGALVREMTLSNPTGADVDCLIQFNTLSIGTITIPGADLWRGNAVVLDLDLFLPAAGTIHLTFSSASALIGYQISGHELGASATTSVLKAAYGAVNSVAWSNIYAAPVGIPAKITQLILGNPSGVDLMCYVGSSVAGGLNLGRYLVPGADKVIGTFRVLTLERALAPSEQLWIQWNTASPFLTHYATIVEAAA